MVFAQGMSLSYKYSVKNERLNKVFNFPAILQVDDRGEVFYEVLFGIDKQLQNASSIGLNLIDKGSYKYLLYKNEKDKIFIQDEINGKTFYFSDIYEPIQYKLLSETKMFGNVKTSKAVAEFRGRVYTIWFDPKSEIKGGPWKFINLPGIAYEIYDEAHLFHWTLESTDKTEQRIKNPFIEKTEGDFVSYKEYPKAKYVTKVFFSNALTNEKGYREVEQTRDGLEIKFEWEK